MAGSLAQPMYVVVSSPQQERTSLLVPALARREIRWMGTLSTWRMVDLFGRQIWCIRITGVLKYYKFVVWGILMVDVTVYGIHGSYEFS